MPFPKPPTYPTSASAPTSVHYIQFIKPLKKQTVPDFTIVIKKLRQYQQDQLEAQQAASAPQVVVIATPVPAAAPAAPVYALPDDQAKAYIYLHESGNNPFAINPTSGACGLAQAYPCSKMNCVLGDYACEDAWATAYMLERYGSWANAYNHWLMFSSW